MSDYVLITDSSCDLPSALADDLALQVMPLQAHVDGKTYLNYLDERTISYHDFYTLLRTAKDVKTSAVNTHDFIDLMEPILKTGKDILYIGFSSGLSSTVSSGFQAAEELREKYPERKIYVVDTLCASLGQGLIVYLAAMEQKAGKTIEEVRDFTEDIKLRIVHWFTVDDLMFLHRGGRVSRTSAILGSVVGIKPVMHVDNEGKLAVVDKVRGRKASLRRLVDEMKKNVIDPENQTVFISHGDCPDDAEFVARQVREQLHVKDVIINFVGPTIGCHSGPGTLALFYVGTSR